VVAFEQRGDGGRAGVQALVGQLFVQRDDLVLELPVDLVRAAVGPPRARLEPGLTLALVAADQLMDP
jgi:hypothetical protein